MIALKIKTQTEWMAVHIEELVTAIKEDGFMDGPRSKPLLSKLVQHEGSSRVARYMLYERLKKDGIEHLMPVLIAEELVA